MAWIVTPFTRVVLAGTVAPTPSATRPALLPPPPYAHDSRQYVRRSRVAGAEGKDCQRWLTKVALAKQSTWSEAERARSGGEGMARDLGSALLGAA